MRVALFAASLLPAAKDELIPGIGMIVLGTIILISLLVSLPGHIRERRELRKEIRRRKAQKVSR